MHLRDADPRRDLRLRQALEEPHLDDCPLARVERVEAGLDEHAVLDLLVPGLDLAEHVLHRLLVAATGAERLREGAGRVRVVRLERLDDLVLADPDRLGQLCDRRRPSEVCGGGLDRARQAKAQLLHAPRHVHRPRPVAEVALDLPDDRRHRIGRELRAALQVEALMASTRPMAPTWTRSSSGSPRPPYREATLRTSGM